MAKLYKRIITVAVFVLIPALFGCATVKTDNGLAYVPNPILSNLNPAPKSMSPPSDAAAARANGPLHMRTEADYHYELGESYSLNGDSKKAVEEFKLTALYDPKSATVRLRLAGEYLRESLLTDALDQAQKAEKLDPSNDDTHIFLGGLYQALKMYNQSENEYQAVLTHNPKNAEALIYLGAVKAEEADYANAEKYFIKAAKVPGTDKAYLAYFYLGKMRVSQGEDEYKKAEHAFTESLQDKPDYEDSALALADLYTAEGDEDKSTKLLESFEEQFGPNQDVAYQLSQTYLEKENYDKALKYLSALEQFEPTDLNIKLKIALILIEQKNYDEAIDKLNEILASAPNSSKIRFYLGAIYEEQNNGQLAVDNYEKIAPSSSHYGDAIVHAAYLLRKMHDDKGATALIEKALAARSDVPQFYAFDASILDDEHQYKKGIALLSGAVKKFPDDTQLRFYLGSLYDHAGRTADCIAQMKKIISLDADHVQALNYLAYTYAEEGKNLSQAEQMARKAMELQPDDPYILDTVGWVMFKEGHVGDAIQYLQAAYKLKNDESVIAEHLGDAYYVFELTDKAKEMYEKAAENENDPTKANKIRAKILSLVPTHTRQPASASAE